MGRARTRGEVVDFAEHTHASGFPPYFAMLKENTQ